ncbi:hypothetical protein K504DRAFT_498779 [Pleomassaria siparia CBS 279.74]|uniref:Rhodopsin domain-containing protein n=1 Tax=Pleomassaria siparia CBS 279.74 TaxID=1314801 RepID=A0A6G1KMX0_9PLEO|nr:hypothetical protein K504DRAFT_498779 [Pleomassaria siparia CBS 279.74]
MSLSALTCIKVSCLLFYKFVFVYEKWHFWDPRNIFMNLVIISIVLWDLGFSFTLIFSCKGHVSTYWGTKTSKELTAKCINPFIYMYALSIADFITDGIILLIPIPMIWKLHLPIGRKLGVMIFLLGSLAALVSLIRLLWSVKMVAIGTNPSAHQDPLTLLSNELFWYIIESETALLAVCLPSLSGIRRTRPVDKIVRSVQSKFSLRSSGSSGDATEKHGEKREGPGSSRSDLGQHNPPQRQLNDVGILPDLESQSSRGYH